MAEKTSPADDWNSVSNLWGELPADGPASTAPQPHADVQVATASAWGFGGRAILLLVNLCATPVLIRLLGPASYGLWTLLLLAVTWASNADLGMGTASTKFGADCYANHDSRGESSVVWASSPRRPAVSRLLWHWWPGRSSPTSFTSMAGS